METSARGIAHPLRERAHGDFVREIDTESGGAPSGSDQCLGACAGLALLAIDEEDAGPEIGKCPGNRFAHLSFPSHSREYDTATGEVHTAPLGPVTERHRKPDSTLMA